MRLLIVAMCFGPPAGLAAWQCPDGTPPPCVRAAARLPTVDPSRVAVLPFRVTTADSLLGEGVAELLAEEFTGEGGPRAVHMGTALRAWRRAGGGLRSPLAQPDEIRLARELGAGLLVEGSIVGLGPRLTLTASVVTVPAGAVRRTAPVSGLSDSLPALLERLAAGVLSAAGGATGASASAGATGPARLSDSPIAIRSYIEGVAAFRRGRFDSAAVAFERAFDADTMFARAAFMRWLTSTWGPGFGTAVQTLWGRRARALRPRLSAPDQIVLDAAFGNLQAKERAALLAPESPEVFYFLGDALYHPARSRGWTPTMARARAAFERSLALDTQTTSLHHLMEIGLWTSDTALLRATWPAFDRLENGQDPALGWLVAARTGDGRLLDGLRHRAMPAVVEGDVRWFAALVWAPPSGMSSALLDELYGRLGAAAAPSVAPNLRLAYSYALSLQGRFRTAERLAREGPAVDTVFVRGFTPDLWLATAAAVGDGDPAIGAAAVARLRSARLPDSDLARARCAVRLWDALVGDSIVHADDTLMSVNGQRSCAELLDVIGGRRSGVRDSARLARSDSIVRSRSVLFPYSSVGPLLMSRAWEAQGFRARALAHLRSTSNGFAAFAMPAMRRAEGRLAALDGDTVTAIRVYREYLDLRRDAEPTLIPQRDSVRAELARLQGAR